MSYKKRIAVSLSALVLLLASCHARVLKPAYPDETSGVGRKMPEETAPPETEPAAEDVSYPPETEGSLSPFGRIEWSLLNGKYVYDFPKRNAYGISTLSEMDGVPHTRFIDSWEPPEKDCWYPGKVVYHEDTHKPEYLWAWPNSTADRKQETLDTLAKYGTIYRGDESRKVIYLTFDCGYENGATEKILDTLKAKNAPGTFFLTGPFARGDSEIYDRDYILNLVRRMYDEGHIVGNHTNRHLNMTELSAAEVADEMQAVEDAVRENFPDAPDMLYFRPPEGAVDEWLMETEARLGYRTVLWSFAYTDWLEDAQPSYEDGITAVKTGLHPGCVYLLHAESQTNADILAEFIDWVRAEGYEILPLCDIKA